MQLTVFASDIRALKQKIPQSKNKLKTVDYEWENTMPIVHKTALKAFKTSANKCTQSMLKWNYLMAF